jgi:hypothetical protein
VKHKTSICSLLVVIVVISVFSMTLNLISADASTPVISVVPTGAPGGTANSTQIPAVAVGSTFTVDIRIDNIGSVTPGINGLSYSLTYDPTVLVITAWQLKQVSFWGSTASNDLTAIPINKTGIFTESSIILPSGAPNEATNTPGVASQITFKVLSSGQSNINFQPSDVGVAYLTYPDSAGNSHDVVANPVNAIYGASTPPTPTPTPTPTTNPSPTPSPTPTPTPIPPGSIHGPTAIINIQNGTTYQLGSQIALDGSSSTPGFDATTCPITNYAWLVQYQNNSVFGVFSGSSVSITPTNVGALNVTLIVTAVAQNSNPSPSYTNTSYATVWVNIESPQQLTQIDVFTNKGGIGHDVSSGPFAPQELVQVYAYVTYGGAPVANKDVAFTVLSPNGTIVAVESALTNSTGYAYMEYRTPWLPSDPTDFGIWSIIATVDVAQVIVTDTVTFDYNYLVTINGITLPPTVYRQSSMNISVAIQDPDNTTLPTTVTFTICDANMVPIDTYITNPFTVTHSTSVTETFTIPSWAFVGTATVYVNVLTNTPGGTAVPYSPEETATFQILS